MCVRSAGVAHALHMGAITQLFFARFSLQRAIGPGAVRAMMSRSTKQLNNGHVLHQHQQYAAHGQQFMRSTAVHVEVCSSLSQREFEVTLGVAGFQATSGSCKFDLPNRGLHCYKIQTGLDGAGSNEGGSGPCISDHGRGMKHRDGVERGYGPPGVRGDEMPP